jgi:predicted permease
MSTRDDDLDREIRDHLELEQAERERQGAAPDEARAQALRAFGNVTRAREEARAVWRRSWLDDLAQDVRYAGRTFARRPGFTAAALLMLGLGIGASTAVFTVLHAVVLAPLPYRAADRLVRVWQTNPSRHIDQFSVSMPLYRDWRTRSAGWEDAAAVRWGSVSRLSDRGADRLNAQFVSASAFSTFGLRPLAGRTFTADEDGVGGPAAVMLTEGFWRREFAADPRVTDRSLTLDGRTHRVIGVAPADPVVANDADVLLPITPAEDDRRGNSDLDVYARLRPGIGLAAAQDQLSQLARRLEQEYPDNTAGWGAHVLPLHQAVIGGDVRRVLYCLLAAVILLLLIACANFSGLLLVRASTRGRELAIRTALGGGRARIVRQLMTESLLLAVAGGVLGVMLTAVGTQSIQLVAAASLPRAAGIRIDWPVLWFAVAVTLAAGLLAGVAPAIQVSRLDVERRLRATSNAVTSGRGSLRYALTVGQLALSIVLLAGAGLMLRTVDRLQRTDLGFSPGRVLTMQIAPRDHPETIVAALLERVARLPNVSAVAATSGAPMASSNTSLNVYPVGQAVMPESRSIQADWRVVSGGYFTAMGIPLLQGRTFSPRDDGRAPKVVIVNRALAVSVWGDADPVGRQINPGGGTSYSTVIGVVGDVRNHNPALAPAPTYYMSAYREIWGPMTLVVRSDADPAQLVPLVREEARALDPALPVYRVQLMDDLVRAQLGPQRLTAGLLGAFAALALALAACGLYGVMAYTIAIRTRELGVRLALGATAGQLTRPLLRECVVTVATGVAAGLIVAVPLTRLMRGLLSGISPADPVAFAGSLAVLAAAALLACLVPLRRAARVNPAIVLTPE